MTGNLLRNAEVYLRGYWKQATQFIRDVGGREELPNLPVVHGGSLVGNILLPLFGLAYSVTRIKIFTAVVLLRHFHVQGPLNLRQAVRR